MIAREILCVILIVKWRKLRHGLERKRKWDTKLSLVRRMRVALRRSFSVRLFWIRFESTVQQRCGIVVFVVLIILLLVVVLVVLFLLLLLLLVLLLQHLHRILLEVIDLPLHPP